MRTDETGKLCPATLGEYVDLCMALNPLSQAVAFLDEKIAASPKGRDEVVVAADSQMRAILFPMLFRTASPVSSDE